MADRIYLMPLAGAGTRQDPRRPKYRDALFPAQDASVMDAGNESPCLVAVAMPTDPAAASALHASLVALADVTAMPADLDQQVGGSLATVTASLEALNIPAGWVQGQFTYRSVLRVVAALFQFHQRYQAVSGTSASLFAGGPTLATTFGSLPAGVRTALRSTATSLGYDTSSLAASSTLRQCLKAMADQWRAIDTIQLGEESV